MDQVQQLGKSLRQSKEEAQYALDRNRPRFPIVERVRDIFDHAVPFQAYFKTTKANESVKLNLEFSLPPKNITGCCGDCFCSNREIFTGGDSTIDLLYAFVAGSARVYINDVRIYAFSENPAGGQITGLSSTTNDIIKIDYVYKYSDQCDEGTSQEGGCVEGYRLFDDFNNRTTTASNWGTSSAGVYWGDAFGPGGSDAFVENGVGKRRSDGIFTSGQSEMRTISLPEAWSNNFTLTFDFRFEALPFADNGNEHSAGFDIKITNAVSTTIHGFGIRDRYSSPQGTSVVWSGQNGNSVIAPHAAWQKGVWYSAKWERSELGNRNKIKVWEKNSTEPLSWLIDTNDVVTETAGHFVIFMQAPTHLSGDATDSTKLEIWYDNIDFSYEGRECLPCASAGWIDNFDRTIIGGNGGARSWGTASDGVTNWNIWSGWFNNATTTVSVNGNAGIIGFPSGGGNSLIYTDALDFLASGTFTLTIRVSPWGGVAGEGVTLYLFNTSLVPTDDSHMMYMFNGAQTREVYVAEPTGSDWWLDAINPEWTDVIFIKWERINGVSSKVKVWIEGQAEPDWIVNAPADSLSGGSYCLGLSSINVTKYFDYISFANDLCTPPCVDGTINYTIDDFNRTGLSWDTASSGGTWTKNAVSGTTIESVDGSKGISTPQGTDAITDMTLTTTAFASGMAWVEVRWLVSMTGTGFVAGIYNSTATDGLLWATDGTSLLYGRPGITQLLLNATGETFVVPTDGTPFWVAVKGDWDTSLIKAKVWLASEVEPNWNSPSLSLGALTASEITKTVIRTTGPGIGGGGSGYRAIDMIKARVPCPFVDGAGSGGSGGGGDYSSGVGGPTNYVGTSVTVHSIQELKDNLLDNNVGQIIVANGTYHISPAANQNTDSLWIGSTFSYRTNPVIIKAESKYGVIFDGGGAGFFGGLTFVSGAHDQTWDGFWIRNGTPTQTGVVVFGGYQGLAAPHHITIKNFKFTDLSDSGAGANDHTFYFSEAVGGPHHILLDDVYIDGTGGVDTALHFFHHETSNDNAHDIVVQQLIVYGTDQAIMIWDDTTNNIHFNQVRIYNANEYAVRYEHGTNIRFTDFISTGSGIQGFYSSLGPLPLPEITVDAGCSFG